MLGGSLSATSGISCFPVSVLIGDPYISTGSFCAPALLEKAGILWVLKRQCSTWRISYPVPFSLQLRKTTVAIVFSRC